jgi:hypothetical protein
MFQSAESIIMLVQRNTGICSPSALIAKVVGEPLRVKQTYFLTLVRAGELEINITTINNPAAIQAIKLRLPNSLE